MRPRCAPAPGASDGVVSPCFLFDPAELRACVCEFRRAFPGAGVHYALKANPEPIVLAAVAKSGCGFEAASYQEIGLLLDLGVTAERIICGTSVKPRSHVERAVADGIDHFAADSREELLMLADVAAGSRVFIRTKTDDSHSVFQMNGKFGAPVGEAVSLLRIAAEQGLVPWGLSFNVGSQAGDVKAWADGVRALAPVLDDLMADGIELEVLNIGGGFPVSYRNHPGMDLDVIAAHVREAVAALPYMPQLIVEPGRRLVATSMRLIATVISRIERVDGPWLFLDCGVYNALFEALSCQGSTRYPVEAQRTECEGETRRFVIAGPTGDGLDVIAQDAVLPIDMRVGDRLLFRNAGAYTLALACSFNGFPKPPVYSVERA